jgi:Transposase DDE domain
VFFKKVSEKGSIVIHRISGGEAEQRGYYRLLHNPSVAMSSIKEYLYADCSRQVVPGGHYLCIQDTTQPNFESNRKNISDQAGLGVIGDGKSLGFFLHPSLVVGADDGQVIGFSDIRTWSREVTPVMTEAEKKRRIGQQKARPIAEKESYRWQQAAQESKEVLKSAGQLTVICDREGDISELLREVPDEKTHLLIRSSSNRKISLAGDKPEQESLMLIEHLSAQPVLGAYELKIKGDPRKKRTGRKAKMLVKLSPVIITVRDKEVGLYVIEAKEDPSTIPEGQKGIHWRLLTTHTVENMEQAQQILNWYSMRWNIEQLFRLIKQKGLNVEDSDMETGKALIQLTLMSLYAASKILLLHLASKEQEPQPIKQTFTDQEIECLTAVNAQHEGKTSKQKNPYPAQSLQWCYWVLARLGGWKPHEKQAGVITIFRGWSDFQKIFDGWMLAKFSVS